MIYAGVSASKRRKLAEEYLDKVELTERSHHLPSELSGGQKQRVAIARALVNNPSIILADEPTGALDTKTGNQIMQLLVELNKEGKTIIMVTHEPEIAAYAKRQIVIRDGVISSDSAQLERRKTKMQNLKFAFSSIMAHKMRSFLTMIGIIIGVSSVVVIMALGDSMSRQVNKNMTKSQKNIHVFFSPIKSKDGSLPRNNQL